MPETKKKQWNQIRTRAGVSLPSKDGWYLVWTLGEDRPEVAYFHQVREGSQVTPVWQKDGCTMHWVSHWQEISKQWKDIDHSWEVSEPVQSRVLVWLEKEERPEVAWSLRKPGKRMIVYKAGTLLQDVKYYQETN